MKAEAARIAIENRHAEDVGGQKIAGELDALKLQAQRDRERVRERGLADTGNVFDQQVAAREHARDGEPDLVFLAEYYFADLVNDTIDVLAHMGRNCSLPPTAAHPMPSGLDSVIAGRA